MKILVLAAIIVAVSSGRLSKPSESNDETSQWPWETGKIYRYDVEAHTLAYHAEGASTGNSFKARFIIRVKAPGQLQAKLEMPRNAQIHQELKHHDVHEANPEVVNYQPVPNLDKPFEISHDGGRILSIDLPTSVSVAQENLLKGLISSLQVDLSTHRNVDNSHDTYDKESQQGLFRKMETDVTGDCETLYTASPAPPEWRRELPNFTEEEDPMEITKSKTYGHCHHRVGYHFGVPAGAEWTGTAHKPDEEQFIKKATVSRILVGKNGPIYKAETTSTVNVHPHMFGKKKAEVRSKVSFRLVSYEQDSKTAWPQPEAKREVTTLLYSLNSKQRDINEDSSSTSSSHEGYEKHIQINKSYRNRRSVKQKTTVAINKVITKSRNADLSSSSSSESTSAYVNDEVPKSNEPAYAALYMSPQPSGDRKENPMNAQKLVQEIAQQLQNPNNMPKADTLAKFNILVRVIASMSYGQLSQTSRSIEIAKSSNDNVKLDMWMVYRDAVTQAGTTPAFRQIKTWIENRTIEGEEAAQVIASLVRSLRYPTKETMSQFFELAMNPEVRKQPYLNSTALIAASKFINMGQVNNDTTHHYYPSHMYGRLSPKHDNFVVDDILPRLSAELKLAVDQEDSHKSQVFIKAIGKLGHRAILDVFAPYIEGKIKVSTYLRTRIVENLRVLAQQRDSHVRAVLYSILKNTAEPYEVRVAAIHNIFMTHPSSAMMQAMAQMTNEDPSNQVRSVLKSAINSASELKHPRFYELSKKAAAVKDMLTKEDFGLQESEMVFMEYPNRDDEYDMIGVLSQIGSKDYFLGNTFEYSWKNRDRGWDEEYTYSAATSDKQQLVEYFFNEVFKRTNKQENAAPNELNHKYSAQKISNILNIKNKNEKPLEASIYFDWMNQQRYFAFNERDIKDLGFQFGEWLSGWPKGTNKHYTKIVNINQVSVMFPLAAGVPFIYKYKKPMILHIQTNNNEQFNATNNNEHKTEMALNSDVSFTLAVNYEGSVGFLDTISNQYPSVGVVEKFQLHLPFKMRLEVKSGEMKLRLAPREPEQDSTIVHYSVWPYSANQKKDTLVTISQDPNSKVIIRPQKVLSVDYKFGQQIGAIFQLQGYSYANDYRNFGWFFNSKNYLSNLYFALKQRDIAQTHWNLRYLGKQSKSKAVSISAVYDTLYNQNNGDKVPPVVQKVADVSPNSPSRREELVKRVTFGIKSAKAQVLDLSAQFESPEKIEYVATLAIGQSEVDPKMQFELFAGRNSDQNGPYQANAFGVINKPASISQMNFVEALNNNLKWDFEIDYANNQKENVHIKGTAERTEKYADDLQNHALGKECKQEMSKGNNYQHNCHRAIVMAHAPDNYKVSVTYKDITPMTKNFYYQLYRIIEGLTIWQSEISPQKVNSEGRIDLNVNASFLTNTLCLALQTRLGEMRLRNVPIPKATAPFVAIYWPYTSYERVLNHFSRHQFQPYCSVDGSKVRTFSDRSYEYTLSRSWHVVLYDNRPERNENLAVLARRLDDNTREMYISFRSHTGKDLEFQVQPAPQTQKSYVVQVKTNAKKVSEGDKTMYWDDIEELPMLEYHTEDNGILIIKIRENQLRVMYDGSRLVFITNWNRNNNRGICGYMSGEPRDDYLSPNGLLDKPELYAASYILIDGDSDSKEKELNAQAKKMAYQPKRKYTVFSRSDQGLQNDMPMESGEEWASEKTYTSRNYLKTTLTCEVMRESQFYENRDEICITMRPLPACQSQCAGSEYRLQRVPVMCGPKLDKMFILYRDQILQGQSPRVRTGELKTAQFRVPGSCSA
ncbi:vitellogenin-like [Melitaea cinxia]|uniref:vitellogenin-like n=1 Tax=Melitaea cinxia TaxID=113334 RepID=UPI001E270569|nr:vitellogenin-like [Melitaea cinxia]